jgi:FkbM family methyltransferase
VIYDADIDAIEQVSNRWQNVCDTRVFPYCLAEEKRAQVFHINYDAYTSSLLPFNEAYASYYAFFAPGKYDYVLGEACRPMEQRHLQTVAFDDLIGSSEFDDLAPDFLSLDTQGSELQVLRGARRTLQRHVLAVSSEAEFVPIYRGQNLFGDLHSFLEEFHFGLAHVAMHDGFSSTRGPIGARGRGFCFGSDVLFLRQWQSLEAATADVDERWVMLHKLAFIAVLHGFIEYALEVIEVADRLSVGAAVVAASSQLTYFKFLQQLRDAVASLPGEYPPTIGQISSFEQLQARFKPE